MEYTWAMKIDLDETMRRAIQRDGRTLYRLARDSGVNSAILGRFVRRERGLTLETASRLCQALGLELRPKPRRKGG